MNTPKNENKGAKKMTKEKLVKEKPTTAPSPQGGRRTHTKKLKAVPPPKRGRTHTGG